MICYFREDFKPFIKVEMEQQDRKSMNFEEIVQRAVNAEAKAGLKFSTIVRDLDICCPRGHCLSNNTTAKVQIQRTTVKDPRLKETKTKDPKPTLSCTSVAKSLELGKKDKKNKK